MVYGADVIFFSLVYVDECATYWVAHFVYGRVDND